MNIRGKARHHTSIVGAIALAAVLLTPSANAEDTPPQPSTLAMTQAGLTRAEVNSNNLELRADGHFYAPGDVDPTIDPIDEDQIAPSLFPSRETSHFAPPPQISTPACNGRIDFYRLVTTSNRWYCFANAGITSGWGTGYWNDIKGHCPGANRGRMHYYHSRYGIWAWTVWRGPVSDHRTCFWFSDNQNFAVATVHIG